MIDRPSEDAQTLPAELLAQSLGEARRAQPSCRIGCSACCIAPSITTPFVGHPHGKPAGERCVHLDAANRCLLFGRPERPRFCVDLRPQPSMCGDDDAAALAILTALERDTRPGS